MSHLVQGVDGVRGVSWSRERVSRVSGPGRGAGRGAQHRPRGGAGTRRGAGPGGPAQRRLRSRHLTSGAGNGFLELHLEWGIRVNSENELREHLSGKHPLQPMIKE